MCCMSPYLCGTVLSCFGQYNNDISSAKIFYTSSKCIHTKLVQVGTGSILYFDFCSCTLENCILLLSIVLYVCLVDATSPNSHFSPSLPNILNTQVCACVYFNSCVQCSSTKHSHLLLQTSGTAWCPSTVLQPLPSISAIYQAQQTGKKLWLHFENCAGFLKEAGKWGLKPWVAEILISGPTAFPHLNLPILSVIFLNTEPVWPLWGSQTS